MKQDYFQPRDLKSKTLAEIQSEFKELGLPKFRALQVYRWLHRGVEDFSQMSDLSRLCGKSFLKNMRLPGQKWSKNGFLRMAQ